MFDSQNPSLRPAALAAIAAVNTGGTLRLTAFVAGLLAARLTPGQMLAFGSGSLSLNAPVFLLTMPDAVTVSQGKLTTTVPARLQGTYVATPDGCSFTFEGPSITLLYDTGFFGWHKKVTVNSITITDTAITVKHSMGTTVIQLV